MTSIEHIRFSGIRSFNPNIEERQEVAFHKPLTIILGKNGAGKTTIIEALLNATTGLMPPGASGADKSSFVYDPKVAGEMEVKAQIQLTFSGRSGARLRVIRSFQATQGRARTTFSTLDSTVAIQDPVTREVKSATHRAADVDQLVPELLGVSRAVLEHVVFCHQEDANWPLGPPSEVKSRFDEIFASTRYVAALDKLREARKEYAGEQRAHEGTFATLREWREQAHRLQEEVDAKEEAVRLAQLRIRDIEPQMGQLQGALQALDMRARETDDLAQEISVCRGRRDEKERALRRMNVAPTRQSLVELREALRDHAARLQRQTADVSAKEAQAAASEQRRRAVEQQSSAARARYQVAESRAQDHRRNLQKLQGLVAGLTDEFIAGATSADVPALLRVADQLVERARASERALQAAEGEHKVQEAAVATRRDAALRLMDAEEREQHMQDQQAQRAQRRADELRNGAPRITAAEVERLSAETTALEAALEEEKRARREGQLQRRIDATLADVAAARSDEAAARAQVGQLRAHAELHTKARCLRDMEVRHVADVCDRLRAARVEVPVDTPSGSAHQLAQQHRARKADLLRVAEERLREDERRGAQLASQLQLHEKSLAGLEQSAVDKRTALSQARVDATDAAGFAALRRRSEEDRDRVARELASAEAMWRCFDAFIHHARADHKCVTCNRGLNEAEVEEFVRVNSAKQAATPQRIAELTERSRLASERVAGLARLAPVVADLAALEATGLPQARAEMQRLRAEVAKAQAAVGDRRETAEELRRQLEAAQQLLGEAERGLAMHRETEQAMAELHRAAASATGSADSVEAAQEQHDKCAARLHAAQQLLTELQAEAQRQLAASDTQERLGNARRLLVEAEAALRQATEAERDAAAATAEAQEAIQRAAALRTRRLQHQRTLDAATQELDALTAAHAARVRELRAGVAQSQEAASRVGGVVDAVRAYLRDHVGATGQDPLDVAGQALRAAETDVARCDEEVGALRAELDTLRRAVDGHHGDVARLREHIQALELGEEIQRDVARVAELESRLQQMRAECTRHVDGILGHTAVQAAGADLGRARDLCRQRLSELEQTRAENNGSAATLRSDITVRRTQLQSDKYRDIEKRCLGDFIKLQTTELAIADIDRYYRALERAVASYHLDKVAQINEILAELWRATYRGSDIDAIEIRSEDENAGAASSAARRSYRYRIVMKRGGAELDMRGRCSAGQKVLASVMVRLALSEAFCCDCGILALDEPTTNLDSENARALALSLRELIALRRDVVRHFQLIVITHDEDFVRCLGARSDDPIYYVEKDRDGAFSVIHKKSYGELFG